MEIDEATVQKLYSHQRGLEVLVDKTIVFMGDSGEKLFIPCLLRGGGFRPLNFENTILTYGLGVMAWTYTNNFRVLWVHARNTAYLRPRSKNGSKTGNLNG